MADHADTIRDLVERQRTYGSFYPSAHDLAALDALLAEVQRLRDALEPFADGFSWHPNDDGGGIIFQPSGAYSEEKCQAFIDDARAALAAEADLCGYQGFGSGDHPTGRGCVLPKGHLGACRSEEADRG